MGSYFNPPEEVRKLGRPLNGPANFEHLKGQLRTGEVLVGLYDRFIFLNAPLITSAEELEHFEDQYLRGYIIAMGFYAVPKKIWNQHGPRVE